MNAATAAALIVLLVPPSVHVDEPEGAARARYGTIGRAVAEESAGDAELARFLLTVARHESTFRRDVHDGRRRGDGGRSVSIYQIRCGLGDMAPVPGTSMRAGEIVGVDLAATKRATFAAATHLRVHIAACQGEPLCVFTRYGGVGGAQPIEVRERLAARVATYRRLAAEAQKKPAQRPGAHLAAGPGVPRH